MAISFEEFKKGVSFEVHGVDEYEYIDAHITCTTRRYDTDSYDDVAMSLYEYMLDKFGTGTVECPMCGFKIHTDRLES